MVIEIEEGIKKNIPYQSTRAFIDCIRFEREKEGRRTVLTD